MVNVMNLMKCSEAEGLILRDLDEGLDPAGKGRLEEHLQVCSNCVRIREEMKMIFAAASLDVPQVPDEDFWKNYTSSLQARILDKELTKKRRWRIQSAIPVFATAAAIIIAILGLTTYMYNPMVEKMSPSSDVVFDDVHRVFGPSSDELGVSYGNSVTLVLNDVTDDVVVRWFEIEEEPSPMFL